MGKSAPVIILSAIMAFSCSKASAALFSRPESRPLKVFVIPIGQVEVRAGEDKDWETVSERTEILAGHDVRTRADSSAVVMFPDGSRIELSPEAAFRLDEANPRQTVCNLTAGKMKALIIGFFTSKMKVITPTALMAVRGTKFEVKADKDMSDFSVSEGLLEVSDLKGNRAVVSSEEQVRVPTAGMEKPGLVALSDKRALPAARPSVVYMEVARDKAKAMVEDLRNRELKANEAQLGKSVMDAHGNRVRMEEYILRPDNKSYKFVFMSFRKERLDWGHLLQEFKYEIPDDLTLIPAVVDGMYFSVREPSNWLTTHEIYLTNRTDFVKETVAFGDPVRIDFTGHGAGQRYYPSSIDWTQTLGGPGVPGGERAQFTYHQDWNQTYAGYLTWGQKVVDDTGNLDFLYLGVNRPNVNSDVQYLAAPILEVPTAVLDTTDVDPTTVDAWPRGQDLADFYRKTTYADGSWVSVEKYLVSNEGDILGLPTAGVLPSEGDFNYEIEVHSSLFQGRKIDILIAPEIYSQTRKAATEPDKLNPL